MKVLFTSVAMGGVVLLLGAAILRAGNLTWNVAGDGAWDTTTANWTGDSTVYTEGDTVTFNNAAGGVITLNANHSPAGVFVSAASGIYRFTNAAITGSCKLTKSGAGKLELRTANTFTGGVDISSGEIEVNILDRLGGQAVAGANLIHFTGNATITLTNAGVGASGGYTYDPILIDAGVVASLGRANGGAPYPGLYGNISGDGSVTIFGNAGNYLRLGVSNSFKGNLLLTGNGAFSDNTHVGDPTNTIILNGGAFYNLGAATVPFNHTVQVIGSGTLLGGIWNGLVTGNPATLTIGGSPCFLANSNNSFVCSSMLYINQGFLKFNAPGCVNGNYIYIDNGTISGVIIAGTNGVYTNRFYCYNGTSMNVTDTNAVIDWNGAVQMSGTPVGIRKLGVGTLNLNNSNPLFAGGVAVYAGRLNLNFNTASLPGITVSNGASIGGHGTNNIAAGGPIIGDGSIDPGNNRAGIMTTARVDPNSTTGTLDFSFELCKTDSPDYANPSASSNAVLRLTNAAPFSGDVLTSANTINVYASGVTGYGHHRLRGGFYTDTGDFLSSFSGASFQCLVPKVGGPFTHNGQPYDLMTNVYRYGSMIVRTMNEPGTQFGGIDGYVTEFKVILPAYLGTLIVVQ